MSGAYAEIERVAGVMIAYPETTITIEGYTDANGAAEYNYKLSERRAVTVKKCVGKRWN